MSEAARRRCGIAMQPTKGGFAMSTTPATPSAGARPAEPVEQRFRRLEAIWNEETGHRSSPGAICSHPAFQEIIGLGDAVVPLMLRDLGERPRLWVWALPMITKADPVPAADRGNIAMMSEAWLHWGRENGYRW